MAGQADQGRLQGYDSFEVRLGDELRGERATLGKSLLDVQRDLRIKAAYISAIENCDTSAFQNKGFVAGYVRSYARYLNLDPDAIFARFCREAGFGGVNEGMEPKRSAGSGRRSAPAAAGTAPRTASPLRTRKMREAERDAFIHPALRNAAVHAGPALRLSASALGSIAVLVLLISGLGFAAWSVLQDIQRVQIAPIDQTPGAIASVATPATPVLDVDTTVPSAGEGSSDLLYSRVYRPQELDVPVLDHRDGPIAGIDPDAGGHFAVAELDEAGEIEALVLAASAEALAPRDPQLLAVDTPPRVSVFATSPAWVRVYLADGSRVFEKILETGEAYILPPDLQAPLLRAGNSGSVFLSVDNVAYGPIGTGTSIAKDVSLNVADVRLAWPISADQSEFGAEAVAAAMAAVAAVLPEDLEATVGELPAPPN